MGRYIKADISTLLTRQRGWLLPKTLLTSVGTHLVNTSMRPHWSYLRCHSSPSMCISGSAFKRSKRGLQNSPFAGLKFDPQLCCSQAALYSTSGRETFRPEAPIGDYQNSEDSFQNCLLHVSLGDSFKHLSRHINVYFKQRKWSGSSAVGQAGSASAVHRPFPGFQEEIQQQRVLRSRSRASKHVRKVLVGKGRSEELPLTSAYPGLQLFHITSLATRFGESYSYVAGHINSLFSKSQAKQTCLEVPTSNDVWRKFRLRKVVDNQRTTLKENVPDSAHSTASEKVDINNADFASSSEEGYLHFARHINKYFGAKVTDATAEPHRQETAVERHSLSHSTEHQQSAAVSQNWITRGGTQNSTPLRPKSLFHLSNLSTSFGENYAYMATHINCYFKGSAAIDEEMERDPYAGQPEYRATPEKHVSLFHHLLKPITMSSLVASYLGMTSNIAAQTDTAPEAIPDKVAGSRRLAEQRTQDLLGKLEKTKTRSSIGSCIEELNAHLIRHPACKSVVWQNKSALQMLKNRHLFWTDKKLQGGIRETLALIGCVDPVKGHGARVLSIDGGGTRGIVPLQVLKQLEAGTGKRVFQLFDYVCGVSTGAVLAFMLTLARISIEECEEMYRRFGSDVFRQNPLVGTVKMGWTHSYYNTDTWETILKEKMGDELLIRTARDGLSPKVSAVSAVVNWGTKPKPFIFRNYNHSPRRLSRYAGGSGYQLWQAVRASSAAPGYFQEFPLHNDIHQDGGLILNNPCALAVHESRLLWPNQAFQCVLSLGTGRYDNARRGPATSTSLKAKISNLISSATDTEGVHTLLEDLLEPNVYFRFNPMLSADVSLDESRPGTLKQLQEDTQLYMERNQPKVKQLCKVLTEERTTLLKTRDWISEKALELQQRWS